MQGNSIGNRPMLIISVFLLLVGMLLVLFGLLSELVLLSSKNTNSVEYIQMNEIDETS